MVELVLKIAPTVNGVPAMVQALGIVMFQARLEPACLDCRLYAEIENPRSLRYVEQWSSLQELNPKLRSQQFGMLLGIMETAVEAPDLEIRTISDLRGLEYVSAVRLSADADTDSSGPTLPLAPRLCDPEDRHT